MLTETGKKMVNDNLAHRDAPQSTWNDRIHHGPGLDLWFLNNIAFYGARQFDGTLSVAGEALYVATRDTLLRQGHITWASVVVS